MKFLKLVFGLLMALFVGTAVSAVLPINPLWTAGGLAAGSLFANYPQGSARAGILTELWTAELISKFRFVGQWLAQIPSQNNYVNNDVIHLVDVGADPAVLIDNAVYPIAAAARVDADIALALKKFDTENTSIPDDELYALPYDKEGSVIQQHRMALEEETAKYGLFSLAPAADDPGVTPVIETTGGKDATKEIDANFFDFDPKDMRKMKLALDNLKVPLDARICIMHPYHSNSLIDKDASFRDKYINTETGKVINHYGFKIFEDPSAPYYDVAGAKKAYGAALIATDRPSTVFVYGPRAFKALGSVKMYRQLAADNPTNRETVIGFRLYHIVLPKKNVGFGAIISGPSA